MRPIPSSLEAVLPLVQKPARYIGGEPGCVYKNQPFIRFAFCFPDLYEVGMSHLGMKILYSLKNKIPDIWCERVFAPLKDMETLMRQNNIPLYGLESLEPITNFDFIGFTLQYELCYPTVLNMLDLAGVPVRSKDRKELFPMVVAGGPCVCNPEPLAEFIDIFLLGEGEELNLELLDCYRSAKKKGLSKQEFLWEAAKISGVYVPAFYDVSYHEDCTVCAVTPNHPNAAAHPKRRVIDRLNEVFYPREFVVPYIQTVHDRAMTEVLRGCIHGCRFCQAGFIYRPFREKSPETILRDAKTLCETTGYEELSLTSLSTSDLTGIAPMLEEMLDWSDKEEINITLPSLRVTNFSEDLAQRIAGKRKGSLTFAPEAGTQRMRDVINKNVSREDLMKTCEIAFRSGYTSIKLYFMLGLPTETDEDIAGIVNLCQDVVDAYYHTENRPKGKGVQVTASVACFIPKPFTPFQFEPQNTREELARKQKILMDTVKTKSRKISVKYHDNISGFIEAALARGDRRLCDVIEDVWRKGAFLDSWDEHFDLSRWTDSAAAHGLDLAFYANRPRSYEEVLPWQHLDYGVTHAFLVREHETALGSATTPNCRYHCTGCGASKLVTKDSCAVCPGTGGVRFD